MTSRFSLQACKLQHGGSVVFVRRFDAGSGRCGWKFVVAKQRGNVNRRWIQAEGVCGMGHGSADWRIRGASIDLIVAFSATEMRKHDSRRREILRSSTKQRMPETPEFLKGHELCKQNCLLQALDSRVLEPNGSCRDGERKSRSAQRTDIFST
jgi:hypothetical protein